MSEFEIKIDCTKNGRDLKKVIQRQSIRIWNDLQKVDEKDINVAANMKN